MTNYQQAYRCLVVKDYAQALRFYLRHAAACPSQAAQAYSGAAECCLKSSTVAPPVPVSRGIALVSQGDHPGAEHYFRLALVADPRDPKALWGLSELLPAPSEERRELLERLVAAQPGTLNLIALGDYFRMHAKNLERAYDLYCQAQQHTPRDQTAYGRLADVCRRLGRCEEAREWSERWKEARSRKQCVGG
jgi:tetratricopeptide (TPR) repeat protein